MKVVALIVTHNRLEKLKITLSKTFAQGFYQVVVVNCGSTDDTGAFLEALEEPRLSIIQLPNLGGAGGFAYGAQYIAENIECDWVVFYDDDAYPDKSLVISLGEIVLDGVDGLACHVRSRDEVLPIMNVPIKQYPSSLKSLFSYLFNRGQVLISKEDLDGRMIAIETTSFVGFLLRYEVLQSTYHQINSELFIYYDDLLYSLYLSQNKYKLKFTSKLSFFHDVEKDSNVAFWKVYYLTKNVFSLRKKLPCYILLLLIPLKLINVLKTVTTSHSRWISFKLFLLGFKDGMLNYHQRFSLDNPVKDIIEQYGKK